LEDAEIRGVQGRVDGGSSEAGCDHVRASALVAREYTRRHHTWDETEIGGLTLSTKGIGANDILELTLAAGELAIHVRHGHVVTASQKIDTTADIIGQKGSDHNGGQEKLTSRSS
jgi:hypothetical protein